MEEIRAGEFQCDRSLILIQQLLPQMQLLHLLQVIGNIYVFIFILHWRNNTDRVFEIILIRI